MRTVALLFAMCIPAVAQHNHDHGHAHYQSWVNKAGFGCCDNRDCGTLAENDERMDGGKIEVRIDGTWCPVLPQHYLRRGNAPDWSTSHVCIRPATIMSGPCDRLLCYQPKPLF